MFALTFVPDRVRRDLLPRAFDPVAGCWYQVVRELLTELVCEEIYFQLASIPNELIMGCYFLE